MKRTTFQGVYERSMSRGGKADLVYYITYHVDGQKKWEKVGKKSEGYTATLADQVRAERIRSIRHSEELPKKVKAPYFNDAADRYIKWAMTNKKWQGDKSRVDIHLNPALRKKKLNEITAGDLEDLKEDLSKKGLSPASVRHCLVLVRMIYNKAIAWGLYKGPNPIKGVKLPTLQNQRERFLSYEEAGELLDKLKEKSKTAHDMALLSLHCGLRFGEIANLRGHDIDLRNGIINVSDPKNQTARKAFMTEAVKEILASYKAVNGDFLFVDRKHKGKVAHITGAFFRVVRDDLKLNEGVTDPRQRVSFHTLRHTFASWLALQGESLLTIRELLGHKTLEMVKRYAHLVPDEKKKATARLEKAFNKGKERKDD